MIHYLGPNCKVFDYGRINYTRLLKERPKKLIVQEIVYTIPYRNSCEIFKIQFYTKSLRDKQNLLENKYKSELKHGKQRFVLKTCLKYHRISFLFIDIHFRC